MYLGGRKPLPDRFALRAGPQPRLPPEQRGFGFPGARAACGSGDADGGAPRAGRRGARGISGAALCSGGSAEWTAGGANVGDDFDLRDVTLVGRLHQETVPHAVDDRPRLRHSTQNFDDEPAQRVVVPVVR
jgi:hypothetical protein